jgi:hypothetical protein
MNTIDSTAPSLTYPPASHFSRARTHRLIVLVPADLDYGAAIRRIWELAIATSMSVQLLGLCKAMEQEPGLRRQLIIMAALIEAGKVSTEAKVEIGVNWVEAVKRNYQTGDIIVCFINQRAGLMQKPLSQILASNLNATVYVLPELYQPDRLRSSWLSTMILWSKDWVQNALLIFSVIIEFWLVWIWNKLFS